MAQVMRSALVMTNNAAAQPLILVADDDREARELLAEMLEGEGYSVAQAENGQRALELIQIRPPRLILLDLNMPVMDGRGFLVWLAQQIQIKLDVIVISGQTTGVVLGAKAILRKPVDLPRLLCLITNLLMANELAI